KKPEQGHARQLQVQAQVFGDLLNGAHAVELGSELRFGNGQSQLLDTLEPVTRVSRHRCRIVVSALAELRELHHAKGRKGELIHIRLFGNGAREICQGVIVKGKTNTLGRPKLGEDFLSMLLCELECRVVGDQIVLRKYEKKRATGFLLPR